jgi:hypothetical protein
MLPLKSPQQFVGFTVALVKIFKFWILCKATPIYSTFLKKVDLQNSLILTKRKQQFVHVKKEERKSLLYYVKIYTWYVVKRKITFFIFIKFPRNIKIFLQTWRKFFCLFRGFLYIKCKIFSGVFCWEI